MNRIKNEFFGHDAVKTARNLLGRTLVRRWDDGSESRYRITITEAYAGIEDKACHASKGRTERTEVMFGAGGRVYVYLIYGMYWLFNVVCAEENNPQAVLICGIDQIKGSGRVGKALKLDKSFYGENLSDSDRIWIEDSDEAKEYVAMQRVGVDYAGEWSKKLWRFDATGDFK